MPTAKGEITNNTSELMSDPLLHNWSGEIVDPYPESIAIGKTGKFSHHGGHFDSSKGCLVYYGTINNEKCAWLVAWSVPGDGSANKIYVEAGGSSKYQPPDWGTIVQRLNASSDKSHFIDPNTKAEATAQISQGNDAIAKASYYVGSSVP